MNNLDDILDKVEEALNKLYEKDQYLIHSEKNNHVSERSITHKLGAYLTPLFEEYDVNVNIRMYNFDDVQCTVIPSVAYGFVTGMNLQLC